MRQLLAAAVWLATAGGGSASTIRVPEDSPTVLAAVDLAMPGDSVLVGAGTWMDKDTRTVVIFGWPRLITACAFPRGGVTIEGQPGGGTVLDAEGASGGEILAVLVLAMRGGEGPLRLSNLVLTGARRSGAGFAIRAAGSDGVEIGSCRLEGNEVALQATACAVDLHDCTIRDNSNQPSGSAVFVLDSRLLVEKCRFEENVGRCIDVDTEGSGVPVVIRSSAFVRNRGRGFGLCLNFQPVENYLITENLFLENVAANESGGAIRVSAGSGEISFNVFAYDSCLASSSHGGGIFWEGSQGSVQHNTFVGCYSRLGGAAFAGGFGGSVDFRNNVVTHSATGAAVYVSDTVVTGNACNLYWSNFGGDFGNWTPSPTDVFADPLFCDLEALDFTVREGSPCLDPPTPSCAPIGALGLGCGEVAIESWSWGRIKALHR